MKSTMWSSSVVTGAAIGGMGGPRGDRGRRGVVGGMGGNGVHRGSGKDLKTSNWIHSATKSSPN